MSSKRSFRHYVKTHYHNKIFTETERFIIQNYQELDFLSTRVNRMDELLIEDITVKQLYIEDSEGMELTFDILVEAEVYVQESNSRSDDYDSFTPWFRLRCQGTIDIGLKDFEVVFVELNDNKKCRFSYSLTDELVPVYSKKCLDEVADRFLKKYYPTALETPQAINPTLLANFLGLSVIEKELTVDKSVLGRIYFHDVEDIKAGTIIIDPRVEEDWNIGAVNNTIIHECIHWAKHRKAFELERFYQKDLSVLETKVTESANNHPNSTDWMEWQARALTPKIMMPRKMFLQETESVIKELIEGKGKNIANVMELVIERLSNTFGVSKLATKIRLVDLGYEEAIGALNYIDGKYVPMHSWKKGAIENTETFSVGLLDISILVRTNPRLFQAFQSGVFVYVESHICLNDSMYVTKDIFGNIGLTEYARSHMDECCLVFKLSVSLENVADSVRLEFILNRDDRSGIKFTLEFPNEKNGGILDKAEELSHHAENMIDVVSQLPRTFGQALDYLRKWREMSLEELSDESLISPETISRMQTKVDYNSKLESVIALCIGLQLPPMLSYQLIELAGHQLRPTVKEHIIYETMIGGCSSFSIYECNEMLVQNDLKPLVKEI